MRIITAVTPASAALCRMCVIAGITGITTSAIGSIPKDYAALFEHGSATLTPAALVNVESAAAEAREALSHTDAIVIYVTGWADTSGSEEFNMRLSQRRAEAIARALMAAGIPKRNLEISWRGETELPVPTEDGVREQANRVVHFSIWGRPTAD